MALKRMIRPAGDIEVGEAFAQHPEDTACKVTEIIKRGERVCLVTEENFLWTSADMPMFVLRKVKGWTRKAVT